MLHHLLHDEWVADYEAHNLRRALAGFPSQDFAVIKTNELHETGRSNDLANDFFIAAWVFVKPSLRRNSLRLVSDGCFDCR